jgi:putative membrane protein
MFLPLSSNATPWFTWNLDPILWLGIIGFVVAYFYAIGPLRRRYHLGPPATSRQIAYFLLGTLTLAVALVSPLDFIGDHYLFSAHMIQHMLLVVVAPPLWLLGTPGWLLAPIFRREGVRWVTRVITNPIVAFLLLNATLFVWHIPPLYSAALTNEPLHIVEHLSISRWAFCSGGSCSAQSRKRRVSREASPSSICSSPASQWCSWAHC